MRNIVALMVVLFISGTALGVEVCHVPPGNPGNAHTIDIGQPAVDSHLRLHAGDYTGVCLNTFGLVGFHDTFIVNSALFKGSISLVELIDIADANHRTVLKLE